MKFTLTSVERLFDVSIAERCSMMYWILLPKAGEGFAYPRQLRTLLISSCTLNNAKNKCILLNFVQLRVIIMGKILQKCTIAQGWRNDFWIEAASFIGAGTVVKNSFGLCQLCVYKFHIGKIVTESHSAAAKALSLRVSVRIGRLSPPRLWHIVPTCSSLS